MGLPMAEGLMSQRTYSQLIVLGQVRMDMDMHLLPLKIIILSKSQ
uniref:Alternative protein CLEC12A n=1 Tax=Homo sapiens TaxID=9606 RepID=L8EAV5_HUMAN|nr:alternative protein CLEC12A [Homo sapiens]